MERTTKMTSLLVIAAALTTADALECYVEKNSDVIVESGFDLCIFEPGVTRNKVMHPSRYGLNNFAEKAQSLQNFQKFLQKEDGSYSVMSLCTNNKPSPPSANFTKIVCFCNTDLCNRGNTVETFLGHQLELDRIRHLARISD
ncbi:unnamed protein product [Bursaphelenchus xylophilus]|uniref:(pine wood nematode) hypothetical protein n=1 Tax=Bursaphelenchus xylophilus TaxID=6326 RepID=A0A1I7RMP7_BURXY|nr:unnamed protein product [Bursaphelenchus xylophilus]CAG9125604.1 unnamed protein product [Bursaphelenchus xylophilus]